MFIILAILSLAFLLGGVFAYRRSRSSFKWVLVSGAGVTGLFLGLLALLAFGFANSRPESGIGLVSVGWLDSRASDISYYRANDFGGAFAYEFRITLTDFKALARERGWQITPFDAHRSTMRYTFFLPETDARREKPLFAEVERGILFESRRPNGGGITVLYDTNALRAYVFQSSR
jgi:hypothetical protein